MPVYDVFSRCHPAVNLLFFTGAIVLTVVLFHPAYLLLSLLCGAGYYAVLRRGRCGKAFAYLLGAMVLVAAVNPLFNTLGETPLFLLFGRPYTWEALFYGGCTGMLFAAVSLWFLCGGIVMTSDKFTSLFGTVIPSISLVLVMVLRLVPGYWRKSRQIAGARKCIGRSGSGKSTIIKLLTGEIVPTSGQIAVNGFSLTNIAERQIPLLRRSVGVIFQDFRLIEKKTVYENLSFAMRAVGSSPREIKKRIPYVLELVGLEEKTDRYPNELSGGEQQRVAIALINNPSTIIADEPTGNLDPARSLEIMRLLERINHLGTTMVVVTHEKDLVNQFKKRVVTLEQGIITSDGDGVGYNAR